MTDKPRPKATRQAASKASQASGIKRRRFAGVNAQEVTRYSSEKVEAQPSHSQNPNQSKFVHQSSKFKDPKADPDLTLKGATEKQKAAREWIVQLKCTGLRGIRKEFLNHVKKYINADLSINAFNQDENAVKNRYDDVQLLDKTRVVIKINPENDDYIHASTVEVTPDLKYICAQGPLLNTVDQFWLMCIQEETRVILQLCQNVEDGKEKCCEYLPKDSNWTSFGPVKVKVVKPAVSVPDTKKVTKTIIQCQFGDKNVTLTHILYAGWPDHAVADSPSTCREVRALVHKIYDRKPIVVHCSAGIGRTGSFVAIEMVLNKILNELKGNFSMPELMQTLRDQRTLAIQNDQQYCFIYRVVIEILLAEEVLGRSSEVNALIQSYEDLLMRKKAAGSAKKKGGN